MTRSERIGIIHQSPCFRNWVLCLCFSLCLHFMGVVGFSSTRGRGFGGISRSSSSSSRPNTNKVNQPNSGVDDKHPLLDWLRTFPASEFGSLEIQDSKCGDGVGAFLTKPVEGGEIVLAVPSNAFISVSSALQHSSLGPKFQKLWNDTREDDPKGTSVLAALVAHLLLNVDNKQTDEKGLYAEHRVYLEMLPKQEPAEKHALWWSDAEIELLRGSSGHEEWVEMRADVDEMIGEIIGSGVLSADVSEHGNAMVNQAVRAGFVAVLSRAYGVFSSDGREFKALIPLLDALNHATIPNVQYSYEGLAGEAGLAGLLVGRAVGPLKKGEELTISYGSHPDHIFGLYFGFIPAPQGVQNPSLTKEAKQLIDNREGGATRQCCTEMAYSMVLSDMNIAAASS